MASAATRMRVAGARTRTVLIDVRREDGDHQHEERRRGELAERARPATAEWVAKQVAEPAEQEPAAAERLGDACPRDVERGTAWQVPNAPGALRWIDRLVGLGESKVRVPRQHEGCTEQKGQCTANGGLDASLLCRHGIAHGHQRASRRVRAGSKCNKDSCHDRLLLQQRQAIDPRGRQRDRRRRAPHERGTAGPRQCGRMRCRQREGGDLH